MVAFMEELVFNNISPNAIIELWEEAFRIFLGKMFILNDVH